MTSQKIIGMDIHTCNDILNKTSDFDFNHTFFLKIL